MHFALRYVPNDQMGFDRTIISATEARDDPMATSQDYHRYRCPACGRPVILVEQHKGFNWVHKKRNPTDCPHSPLYDGS
jgi:predicted RNA-binding Zn-ribbon protein involved in translation (DUF1610 family)